MAWEQLDSPYLRGRVELVAGSLMQVIRRSVVLDLNCGRAPLYPYIGHMASKYIGNDTNDEFIAKLNRSYPRGVWWTAPDAETADRYQGRVDVVVALGYAARLNEHESQTLDQSIYKLATTRTGRHPLYLVLEAWAGLPEECGLSTLVDDLIAAGYRVCGNWLLRPAELVTDPGYTDRQIIFLVYG